MNAENKQNFIGDLLLKGEDLHASSKYQETVEVFDELLKSNLKDAYAIHILKYKGLALNNLNKYQEAVGVNDEILKIKPDDENALCSKGLALNNLNKYQEAVEVFDELLKIKPQDQSIQYYRKLALNSLGKYHEAAENEETEDLLPASGKTLEDEKTETPLAPTSGLESKQSHADQNNPWSFLTSNKFWAVIVVLFLLLLAYEFGKSENHVLTSEEKRKNISICKKWGGVVIYDRNNQYQNCVIDGRIQ